jgi:hypothetical protein
MLLDASLSMVAYQSLKHDADNKKEIVKVYMILIEMSSLYQNITWSQETKQDQDVVLLGRESEKGKKFGYKLMGNCNLCGKWDTTMPMLVGKTQKVNQGVPRIGRV